VVVALATVLSSGWHGMLRNALTDLRFAWVPRQATGDVVVVAIDAPSIEEIGVWPWPRHLHADLLRRLEIAGARDIVFDVDFSAPSDAASDQSFAAALQSAGGSVVLPSFQPGADGGKATAINRPLQQFADHAWTAVVNVAIEPDGLVRRYPFGENLGGQFLPSMGANIDAVAVISTFIIVGTVVGSWRQPATSGRLRPVTRSEVNSRRPMVLTCTIGENELHLHRAC
jgi:CHASE2 domain-containing sensor protein